MSEQTEKPGADMTMQEAFKAIKKGHIITHPEVHKYKWKWTHDDDGGIVVNVDHAQWFHAKTFESRFAHLKTGWSIWEPAPRPESDSFDIDLAIEITARFIGNTSRGTPTAKKGFVDGANWVKGKYYSPLLAELTALKEENETRRNELATASVQLIALRSREAGALGLYQAAEALCDYGSEDEFIKRMSALRAAVESCKPKSK